MPTTVAPRCFAVLFFCLLLAAPSFPESADYVETEARIVLEAYGRAFPDRVDEITWRDGDWTIKVNGHIFYWAQGRLLPEGERGAWKSYAPYPMYPYPPLSYGPASYSPEQIEYLRLYGSDSERLNGVDNHDAFRAALYGGTNRVETEQNIVKTTLLGLSVNVHRRIAEALKRIDKALTKAAADSPELAAALAELGSVSGYNWRDIRGTRRRSLHSWGLAVDIMPKKIGDRTIYWGWEKVWNDDWMLVPLENRWTPPEELIAAFERENFIWGGKWDLYDTMHFEYRPELAEIARAARLAGGVTALYRDDGLSGEDN